MRVLTFECSMRLKKRLFHPVLTSSPAPYVFKLSSQTGGPIFPTPPTPPLSVTDQSGRAPGFGSRRDADSRVPSDGARSRAASVSPPTEATTRQSLPRNRRRNRSIQSSESSSSIQFQSTRGSQCPWRPRFSPQRRPRPR